MLKFDRIRLMTGGEGGPQTSSVHSGPAEWTQSVFICGHFGVFVVLFNYFSVLCHWWPGPEQRSSWLDVTFITSLYENFLF